MKRKADKRKWLIQSGIGASLVGFGLSFTIHAGFMRYQGEPFLQWFGAGTLALVIFMSGLALFVDALRYRL